MTKRNALLLAILCLIITFMDISGLPAGLLEIQFADISPYIIPLILNFILIGIISVVFIKTSHIKYSFGFTLTGLSTGLKRYALPGIIVGILTFSAFCIGLYPFDHSPSIWKILIEGILYYVGVSMVEEFYVRGLFLNIIESLLSKSTKKTKIAIVVSSAVFALGHIPGTINLAIGVILFKFVSTFAIGLYFGIIYKNTKNLLLPIIMHSFIDICALPYCFTESIRYEQISLIILIIVYILFMVYCVAILRKPIKNETII